MAKKKKPSLADYVEATERRDAPRAQARAGGRDSWSNVWVGLVVILVVVSAAAVFYLRMKRLI